MGLAHEQIEVAVKPGIRLPVDIHHQAVQRDIQQFADLLPVFTFTLEYGPGDIAPGMLSPVFHISNYRTFTAEAQTPAVNLCEKALGQRPSYVAEPKARTG